MFGTDAQLVAVCRKLLAGVGLGALWTRRGPSPRAVELLRHDGGALPADQRVMLLLAWALWNGRGGLTVAELLEELDRTELEQVGELVAAIAIGAAAIDAWTRARSLKPKGRPRRG